MSAISTRDALIAAAIRHFGAEGFEASSVRRIAAGAGVNGALVNYHFGSKQGLLRAAAEDLAARLGTVFAALDAMPGPADAGEARMRLEAMLQLFVEFLLVSEAGRDVPAFVLRAMSEPGEAFEILYARVFEPRHRALCRLWAVATGAEPEAEATRLAVFAMLGQLVYFRLGGPAVQRRMGWRRIGPEEAERIRDTLLRILNAALDVHGKDRP